MPARSSSSPAPEPKGPGHLRLSRYRSGVFTRRAGSLFRAPAVVNGPQPPRPFGRDGRRRLSESGALARRCDHQPRQLLKDRLNIVSIRVENKSRKVAAVVLWSRARSTIVVPAMSEGGFVKCSDGLLVGCSKRNVRLRRRSILLRNPEERFPSTSIACCVITVSIEPPDTQWCQGLVIKRAGSFETRYGKRDMIQHRSNPFQIACIHVPSQTERQCK